MAVTIEVSSTEIRLLETDGRRVIRWASRSFGQGVFEEEGISDTQALSAAVKQLMASSGISARNMIASVSGLYSLSRVVMVPTPPGQLMTEAAVLEAARDAMPLSEEAVYLFWRAVGMAAGGQRALVVGIPRDVIDDEMQALRAVGVNPRILELKVMALARAVDREKAIILNIESASFDIVIVVGGIIEIMRTTAWQSEELTAEDKAEHLAIALELTMGFYNTNHPDFRLGPATPFFITGQMSGDLALMEHLQPRVGYSIEPLVPPIECPVHLPVSQYAVNIGMALRGTASLQNPEESGGYSMPDINLLPSIYKPWRPSRRQAYLFMAVVAALVLLFPLYQATTGAMDEVRGLETEYNIVNAKIEHRKVELAKRQPLQKAITEYNTIVKMGGGFIEDITVIKARAEEVGATVTGINHQGSSVVFNCQADSYTSFRAFLTAMEESGFTFAPLPEGFPYRTGGSITLKPPAR